MADGGDPARDFFASADSGLDFAVAYEKLRRSSANRVSTMLDDLNDRIATEAKARASEHVEPPLSPGEFSGSSPGPRVVDDDGGGHAPGGVSTEYAGGVAVGDEEVQAIVFEEGTWTIMVESMEVTGTEQELPESLVAARDVWAGLDELEREVLMGHLGLVSRASVQSQLNRITRLALARQPTRPVDEEFLASQLAEERSRSEALADQLDAAHAEIAELRDAAALVKWGAADASDGDDDEEEIDSEQARAAAESAFPDDDDDDVDDGDAEEEPPAEVFAAADDDAPEPDFSPEEGDF